MACEYCVHENEMVAKKAMPANEVWLEDNRFRIEGQQISYSAYVSDAGGYIEDNAFIRFCPMCGESLTDIEPLTADELKQMAKKPVYIVDEAEPECTGWMIWGEGYNRHWLDGASKRSLKSGADYGKTWWAYSHEPNRTA